MIVQLWSTPKTKLSSFDESDQVRSVMKTKHDNNVIDSIGVVYTKTETELVKTYLNR